MKSVKKIVKTKLTFLSDFFRKIEQNKEHIRFQNNSPESIFTDIYRHNRWGGVSRSGVGSDLQQTKIIRDELPKILKNYKISSMLDIPCGDFFLVKRSRLGFVILSRR